MNVTDCFRAGTSCPVVVPVRCGVNTQSLAKGRNVRSFQAKTVRGTFRNVPHRELVVRCVLSPEIPTTGSAKRPQAEKIILVGDIGGTNCRLDLWRVSNGMYEKLADQKYQTVSYPTFEGAMENFLSQLPPHYVPAFASLAVAGPVQNEVCKMTNCPWVIDGPSLTKSFGFRFAVLNDFAAVGYGITALEPSQLVSLNPDAAEQKHGPKLCIGPGTGLGVAQVIWFSGLSRYVVLPSEGSHGTFGPRNDLERELQAWVEKKEGFCETELVACGKGLLRIYEFLCEKKGKEPEHTLPAGVTIAANEGDETAGEAMNLFLDILGAEAGNGALQLLATGGVYIAGGITPKVLNWMEQGRLLDAFLYKENPKFTKLLRTFPLYAVNTEELGLIGCRSYAEKALSD